MKGRYRADEADICHFTFEAAKIFWSCVILSIDKYAFRVVSLNRNLNNACRVIMEAGKNPALCLSNRDIYERTSQAVWNIYSECGHWSLSSGKAFR